MSTIYRMGSDNKYHAPGLPDVVPGYNHTPLVANPDLWFGTTLFGQSYGNYKLGMGYSDAEQHHEVEYDTFYSGHRGGAVVREFNSGGNGPSTWSNTQHSYMRTGLPVIYSYKSQADETEFKSEWRAWLDSKPSNSERCWVCFWHEPDNDWPPSTGIPSREWWYDRNIWSREVLDEGAYSSRTDVRFGMITTGGPFQKGRKLTDPNSWKSLWDGQTARAGGRKTIWDFTGADKYNPAWDGASRYMPLANWILKMDQCHDETGLPFVIGEGGSPRASSLAFAGQTLAQRDQERADWMDDQMQMVLDRGYFDAYCYWRVPANSDPHNEWSTNMITPTGYNAQALAGSFDATDGVFRNGGYDAQACVDVLSRFCIASAVAAQPSIPYYIP